MIRNSAIVLSITLALGVTAAQAEPQELGTYNDWRVYKTTDSTGVVCFALSEPTSHKPTNVKRGDIYFMVSSWPTQKVSGEPSIVPGYPYKDKDKATVEVGGDKFEFYTQNSKADGGDGGAWMKEPNEEARLLTAMRKGSKMVVKGTSKRGTQTVDEYSLNGISAALDKLTNGCA